MSLSGTFYNEINGGPDCRFMFYTDGSCAAIPSGGGRFGIQGFTEWDGLAVAPALSPANQGRIYFDPGTEQFLASVNGGAYLPLAGSGGGNVTHGAPLTANQLIIGAGGAGIAALGTLGTTNSLLQGNAAGAPSWVQNASINAITLTGALVPVGAAGKGVIYYDVASTNEILISENNGAFVPIGTVRSVALSDAIGLTVGGSPVTGSGTLTIGATTDNLRVFDLGLNVAAPTGGGQISTVGGANNLTLINVQRNTDVAPTGAFLNFQNAASGALFTLDITGKITQYGGAAPTDGQLLIGSTAGGNFSAATLTAGTNISITNAGGSITINNTASAGANPAGSGSEIQARLNGTTFQAVTNSTSNVVSGCIALLPSDAGTSNVINALSITHNSSATPDTNGFGVGIRFGLKDTTTSDKDAGQIATIWNVPTDGGQYSRMSFSILPQAPVGILREVLRLHATHWTQNTTVDFLSIEAINNGSVGPCIYIYPSVDSAGGIRFTSSSGLGGFEVLAIDTTNFRVAIGGVSPGPANTLDVNGTCQIRGAYTYLSSSSIGDHLYLSSGGGNFGTIQHTTLGSAWSLAFNGSLDGSAGTPVLTWTSASLVTCHGSLAVLGAAAIQNSQSANYTTVASDANKSIYHPSADTTARTWTIDSNANVPYTIGTMITFVNDTSAGTITIAITADTLVLAGTGSTGSRTLAASGVATAIKMTATRWMINGTGLT